MRNQEATTIKKSISALLFITLLFSLIVVPTKATGHTFSDVPSSHWAYAYVERAAREDAVNGVGDGRYEPDRALSRAEFIVILTRAFYSEQVEKAKSDWPTPNWYNANCSVMDTLGIKDTSFYVPFQEALSSKNDTMLMSVCSKPITRSDMAVLCEAVTRDRGIAALTEAERAETDARVPDVDANSVNAEAVFAVVYSGIILGVNDKGTFNGSGTVTRASVAAIYCRLSDLLEGTEVKLTPKPTQTTTPTNTKKAPYATTDDSVVGTVSDSRVSLSLSTHTAPADYYSRHPELNGIVDKDQYNAYVFTALNREWYVENGIIASYWGKLDDGTYGWTYGIDTFNYPCFDRKSELGLSATLPFTDYYISSITNGGMHINRVGDVDSDNIGVYKVTKRNLEDIYNGAFVPIFAQFTDDMTDKEKIVIIVEALCSRMEYGYIDGLPTFAWGETEYGCGVCADYADNFKVICNAAGIPCLYASNKEKNHAWNVAYIDNEWYVVDTTGQDVTSGLNISFEEGLANHHIFDTEESYASAGCICDITAEKMMIEALYEDIYG